MNGSRFEGINHTVHWISGLPSEIGRKYAAAFILGMEESDGDLTTSPPLADDGTNDDQDWLDCYDAGRELGLYIRGRVL